MLEQSIYQSSKRRIKVNEKYWIPIKQYLQCFFVYPFFDFRDIDYPLFYFPDFDFPDVK